MSVEDRAIAQSLAKQEKIIERGTLVFLEVGSALAAIRDGKLYRLSHKTFEAYCKERWGFERARAYQYIESSGVAANLSTIVDKTTLPTNEAQLREIAKAPKEKQAEVVTKVAEKAAAEDRKPTAKDYKQATAEVVYEDVEPEPTPAPVKPEGNWNPREMAAPIMAHCQTLTKIGNDIKKLSEQRGGEWIDMQSVAEQIKQLKHSLKLSMHYADCHHCKAKGCERCRQSGFFPVLKKQQVDEANGVGK